MRVLVILVIHFVLKVKSSQLPGLARDGSLTIFDLDAQVIILKIGNSVIVNDLFGQNIIMV